MPWDTGRPDEHLVQASIKPGRALEVGCGTGSNALWLASQKFDVVAVDLAPLAIEAARKKAGGACRFEVLDFLASPAPGGPFDFVFDSGCFHVFDEKEKRAAFASRVADALAPSGQWLSLIGSTEGPQRTIGPPRRSARDILDAIEPVLELVELRSIQFALGREVEPMAWFCLSRRRMTQ